VQTKTGERILNGLHLLMAAGRVPNTDWLNLDAAGIQMDKRGFIQVNERLETNVPGIYALGEVIAILEVAMIGKVPYTVLRDGVFAHPTLAESLNNLFSAFDEYKR